MIDIVSRFITLWNDHQIIYCHWKGNNHLEDAMIEKSDFDILIDDNCSIQGCDLLEQAGFVHYKTQYGSRFPGIQDWIGVDEGTGTMVHIHLHQKMIAGHSGVMEYILPWNVLAFNTRTLDESIGLYLINPSLELLLLYTRLGIEHSSKKMKRVQGSWELNDNTIKELSYLKERMEVGLVESFSKELYPDCYEDLLKIIFCEDLTSNDISNLSFLTKKACSRWLRYNPLSVRFLLLYKKLERMIYGRYGRYKWRIRKKVPIAGTGLSVAFLGQDGAGKTTVTKELIKWLNWKLDVRYVYLGSGENYFSLKKRFVKVIPPKGVFKYFRAVLGLLIQKDVAKSSYKNVIKAEKYVAQGGLVIYDRFPQTNFAGICDGPKIRKKIRALFGKGFVSKLFAPMARKEEKYITKTVTHNPDVVFKLILSPEESIRRKPQEKYEAVKQKHEIIKALKFEHSDVYTIDATMPFEEELVLIKNIIWQHIHK